MIELQSKTKGDKRARLDGGGRRPELLEMEEELMTWVLERRSNRLHVSRKLIMQKALSFKEDPRFDVDRSFVASRGWLEKFMQRNGLSLRRRTTEAQKDPDQLVDKLVSYILNARRLFRLHQYTPADVISMDETAVWCDMLSSTTVDKVGTKTISMKTTGHEKLKVSVCLAAKGDGTKLKPLIVFKGAVKESKLLDAEFKACCRVTSSSNAWMNEELTELWVDNILGSFSFRRRLLSWDTFSCHFTDKIKTKLSKNKVDVALVPGGCTKYIQPPDISWNKPFKQFVTEQYDRWMAEGVHALTAAGNMKAPPRRKIVAWILDAWRQLEKEVIIKSFRCRGLCISADGSEDDEIHCFKINQPCEKGKERLKLLMGTLDETTVDPFCWHPRH